jgi:hypothetical protein
MRQSKKNPFVLIVEARKKPTCTNSLNNFPSHFLLEGGSATSSLKFQAHGYGKQNVCIAKYQMPTRLVRHTSGHN